MRKGEELKTPRYASAAASCDDHVTTYNIIPNIYYNIYHIRTARSAVYHNIYYIRTARSAIYYVHTARSTICYTRTARSAVYHIRTTRSPIYYVRAAPAGAGASRYPTTSPIYP